MLHVRSRSANGSLLPPHAAYSAPAERGEAARVQAHEEVEASESDPPPPVGVMARWLHRSGARRLGQAAMMVLESL